MIQVHNDFKEIYNVCAERFYYDSESGTIRRKYNCKSNHYKTGDVVGYARRHKRVCNDDALYLFTKVDGVCYSIQQLVFLLTDGYIPKCIDHINRNTLDNHRENLRDASHSENARNKCKVYKNGLASSDYIGVSKRDSGLFRCRIRINHDIVYDETFENETSAAYAYNIESIKFGVGEYTNFNKFEDEESVRKLYEKEKENKAIQEYWRGTFKRGKRWGAKVKGVRLGTFNTREEARLAVIRYKEGI